jgi:hypothetical protein
VWCRADEVVLDRTTSLTLRAVRLDGDVLVEPLPSNASVYVDGVSVGNGVWEGQLPSGNHRIEVAAPGHLPFRRDVAIGKQAREVVRAHLERDSSSPMWKDAFRPHFYLDGTLGGLLAASLHGSADERCDCAVRSRPLGFMALARLGYSPFGGFGLELAGGYVRLAEDMTRRLIADGETNRWTTSDYRDSTILKGPFAVVSTSYRMLHKTPVTARLGMGMAALKTTTTNVGTFRGELRRTNDDGNEEAQVLTSRVSIEETQRRLVTPFASTEIRFGYRLSERLSLDLGVGLWLFLPPDELRTGANNVSDERRRASLIDPRGAGWADGSELAPGLIWLPEERIAGAFLAASPSLSVRLEL